MNGRSQAVRLPKEFALPGDSVFIKKVDGVVMLIPKGTEWEVFRSALGKFTEDFMRTPRVQGISDNRDSLS